MHFCYLLTTYLLPLRSGSGSRDYRRAVFMVVVILYRFLSICCTIVSSYLFSRGYIYIQYSCIALSSLFNRSVYFWTTIPGSDWAELKVRYMAWKLEVLDPWSSQPLLCL